MTVETAASSVRFERTATGFLIRARCWSLVDSILLLGRAAVISSLPFVLWWDLILGLPEYEGPSLIITSLFLLVWAAAIVYVDLVALLSVFGEVRITKEQDSGSIFTGIGNFGWMRRFSWSSYSNADAVSQSRSRSSFRSRGIALDGPQGTYKFGWLLPEERIASIANLLKEHVLAAGAQTDAPTAIAE